MRSSARAIMKKQVVVVLLSTMCSTAAWAAPFAYVANRNDASVSVIDLATETVATTISIPNACPPGDPLGDPEPYWVNISRDGGIVAVSLHDNANGVALINGATNTLIGVVCGVGHEPEGVAVNSTGTTVYVTDEDPSSSSDGDLYVVNVTSRTVTDGPIDLSSDCDEPENIVISPDDAFLYISCAGNSVIRVATSGFAIFKIMDNTNDAHGIALNRAGTRLYFSDDTDAFEYDTINEVLTGTKYNNCRLYGGAVSADGSRLYCVEEGNEVKIYDTAGGGDPLETVDLGASDATAIGVRTDSPRIYIPISGADAVEVVDAATMKNLSGNIPVGNAPRGIAIGGRATEPAPAVGSPAIIGLATLLAGLGVFSLRQRRRLA